MVRRGDLWFAVRAAAKTAADDLRYDFGLVALKTSSGAGGWVDVVRPRPHTRTGPDSAGPAAAISRHRQRRARKNGLKKAPSRPGLDCWRRERCCLSTGCPMNSPCCAVYW